MILLSGCATRVSSPPLEVYCPNIVIYSSEFTDQLIHELAHAGDGDAVLVALSDYSNLRDKIKLCIKEREKLQ